MAAIQVARNEGAGSGKGTLKEKKRRSAQAAAGPGAHGELHPDGRLTAKAAGLRYVSDTRPGIKRRRAGRGFAYIGPDGAVIRDPEQLRRIRSLAIPPAWTDVWICPSASGHIQASGRDAKGRKQYRYHARWREVRDATKFERMLVFGEALPCIRERVARDLQLPDLQREKVLATVVRLLETTLIRVGNEEYVRQNRSYGLTTLRNRHVAVEGATIHFHFRAKSGKECDTAIRDRRLARVVRQCQELPGQDLFEYTDDEGQVRAVTSADVNDYLREISGQDFTAKDFRTWAATVLAFLALRECEACETDTQAKKNVVEVIRSVAARLNNTPAVCRKCYVHPAVLDVYLDRATRESLLECTAPEVTEALQDLDSGEAALMAFLRSRVSTERSNPPTRQVA